VAEDMQPRNCVEPVPGHKQHQMGHVIELAFMTEIRSLFVFNSYMAINIFDQNEPG